MSGKHDGEYDPEATRTGAAGDASKPEGDAISGECALPEKDEALRRVCEEFFRADFAAMELSQDPGRALAALRLDRAMELARSGRFCPNPDPERELVALNPLDDLFQTKKTMPDDLVRGRARLPAFPAARARMLKVLRSPSSTAGEMAAVIDKDPALAARLLKCVNSPLYAGQGKIDSIRRAVAVIGVKELTTLVMGVAAVGIFKDIPPRLADMRGFWRHSVRCAVLAGLVAGRVGLVVERFFTAGLLHDLGKLLLYREVPAAASRALLLSRMESLPLYLAEREIMGFDHALAADVLLEKWTFPEELRAMIAGHHDPVAAPDFREAAVIHAADMLALALAEPEDGPRVMPRPDAKAFEILRLTPEALRALALEGARQAEEIERAFY